MGLPPPLNNVKKCTIGIVWLPLLPLLSLIILIINDHHNCHHGHNLAHFCTIFLKSSGYQNIAQGGDPLYVAVDYKWCCWGQTIPNWTHFFCKKRGCLYFRVRLFLGGVYISEWGFFWGHIGSFFGPWEDIFGTSESIPNFEGGFPNMRRGLMCFLDTSLIIKAP